jgi:hypothetical protein
MDDEWDDLHDGEVVDLDGCEATGDPQLDQFGYNSPRRRGQNLTGFTSNDGEWVARSRARRAAVEQNKAETRRRNAERSGEPTAVPRSVQPSPVPSTPDLAPHVSQAIAEGMASGRDLGWWRVDVDAYGRAVWTRVDAPGDGPRMTVEQTPAQPVQPQWHSVQRWAPAELTEPSPGTRVW